MQMKRVVVTGMGAVSPFGRGVETLMDALYGGESGISRAPDLERIEGLRTRVAGLVTGIDPKEIPRKFRRSMSGMSLYATLASIDALGQAGSAVDDYAAGRLGVVIGSTVGSPHTMESCFRDYLVDSSLERLKSTFFFHIMNHSCAANVAQALGTTGRILAPSAACSTGCQAIGYGYEMIAMGKQDAVLCGGADEFHAMTAGTFDIMNAASSAYNETPARTPRPFDRDRDGVVCAEGSGILLLESLESALSRGARIRGEVSGFATVSDPSNIANPNAGAMETCMRLALEDASVAPGEIDYVNAHATGTEQGDVAESEAICATLGENVPVSSLKGHLGHTMAASGSLELIASLEMMRSERLVPTLNLENVDSACARLALFSGITPRTLGVLLKNNFALGGVNSSLVLRRYTDG